MGEKLSEPSDDIADSVTTLYLPYNEKVFHIYPYPSVWLFMNYNTNTTLASCECTTAAHVRTYFGVFVPERI